MANSINTNVGAMVALQNLNATGRELNVVQNRVNTGLKVASAKDNGAVFAIDWQQARTARAGGGQVGVVGGGFLVNRDQVSFGGQRGLFSPGHCVGRGGHGDSQRESAQH